LESEPERILEDASSLRDAMGRMVSHAPDAAEVLEARIEDEDLDDATEAEELREARSGCRTSVLRSVRSWTPIRTGMVAEAASRWGLAWRSRWSSSYPTAL
jgi:hypothetical protein